MFVKKNLYITKIEAEKTNVIRTIKNYIVLFEREILQNNLILSGSYKRLSLCKGRIHLMLLTRISSFFL